MNQTNTQIQVLLADDDAEDRAIFQDTLNGTGLNSSLHNFETGTELISFLETTQLPYPNIIFLDLKMPEKDGKQCLREIRANHRFNDIPVIIFTCTAYIEDIKETYEFGANLYVPKNVFIKNNVKALSMILETTLSKSALSPSKEKFVLTGDSSFSWM
jgi:CheY-like chemotaxis protein